MGKSYRRSSGTGFSSNMIVAILGAIFSATVCDAAPLAARSQSGSYSSNDTAVAPPTSLPPQPILTITPDYTSQYNVQTGAVDFHTSRGLASTDNGKSTTTLVTFSIGEQYSSNMCQLVFDLQDPSSWATESAKVQIFTSLAPATADSASWPSGNLRNQEMGSLNVANPGRAAWEAGSGPGATANGVFPCVSGIYGAEIVPQGDNVEISWPAGHDGLKIIVW